MFICAIIPFLQHIFAQVDDYIYKKGEYADEMYFIIKGRVGYVYEEDLKVYKTISRGSYFGDIELIERCSRKYTLKAIVNSDLLTLNR